MERRVALTADAQRALEEGARLCREANLAIFTPEHLLAGALLALSANPAWKGSRHPLPWSPRWS